MSGDAKIITSTAVPGSGTILGADGATPLNPPKEETASDRKRKRRQRLSAIEKHRAAGELPHEFLLRLVRDGECDGEELGLELRIDCAKASAPYFAPRLATVELIKNVSDDALLAIIQQGLNDPELAPLIERAFQTTGLPSGMGRTVATQSDSGSADAGAGDGAGGEDEAEPDADGEPAL